MNIFLTGSLAFDRIMDFPGRFADHILPDHIHNLNVAFNIDRLEIKFGGTAGNIAYTLVLLSETPHIFASAGKDFASYREHLVNLGLPVLGIEEHDDVLTATAHIITDRGNNQITAFSVGAMSKETTGHIPTNQPAQTLVVLSAGNPRDMERYATECRAADIPFLFDPGQTLPALSREQLATIVHGATYCIVNDYEYELILEKTEFSPEELLQKIRTALIVTRGEQGSELWTHDTHTQIPACIPAKVVDPTGAGDAYRAGFVKGIALGESLERAAQLGACAASFAIACYGTQEHSFNHDQFCERFTATFSQPCPLKGLSPNTISTAIS